MSGRGRARRARSGPAPHNSLAQEVRALVRAGETAAAAALLPEERPYPAPEGTPGLGRVS